MSSGSTKQLSRWLGRLSDHEPLAVVIGGSVNGLSFVRSLAKRGVPTLLLETERLIGTYTRYGKVHLLPDAAEDPASWVDFLEFLGSRLPRPGVLFPTSDLHNVLIAEHAQSLTHAFRFVVPQAHTLERIVNKRLQYETAAGAGIPIPRSLFPQSSNEVKEIAPEMSYPCILKPYKAHVGRRKIVEKVAVVESPSQLVNEYGNVTAPNVEFMVQEIVPGGDSALYGYLAFWDSQGAERAWLTKRKLRQSARFGDGSHQITVDAPEVADMSRRLLAAFDYHGFVGVEFKYDERDGRFKLMEINPRTVSGNQLAISAGVDFPWLGYKYLVGLESGGGPGQPFQPGVRYVNEEWDLRAYLRLRKGGDLTLADWVRSVLQSEAKAIGSWRDPAPLLVTVGRVSRAAVRSVLRGARRS
jgi:predicted ATP-grasp superfamily ATP-dependent carboligase